MNDEFASYSSHLKTSTVRDRANTLDLRVGVVPASSGKEERCLVMSNGRTEWVEKYAHLPFDLKVSPTTGYMSWDHRGQGASGGARAWIDDYNTYSKDAADAVDAIVKGKPYNLVCHSMGGLIALHSIMKGYLKPRCVVLSSPLLGLPRKPFPPLAAYKIAGTFKRLGMGHIRSGGRKSFQASLFRESSNSLGRAF